MPCHFVATQTSLDGTWLLLTQVLLLFKPALE